MDEKKYFTIRVGTCILIAIILILIIALVGMYLHYNPKRENKIEVTQNTSNTTNNELDKEPAKENVVKDPYENYKDKNLAWYFSQKTSESDLFSDNLIIENGIVYIANEGIQSWDFEKIEVKSIPEKAKQIAPCIRGGVLARIYVLTENGNIYRLGDDNDEYKDAFDMIYEGKADNFYKVNLKGKVIDMTEGDSATRIVEGPYFLLETGELINEEGSKYEALEGDFVGSFGTINGTIFKKADNTIYEYSYQSRKYSKIKDADGKDVKVKDVFIQYSTDHNNLLDETDNDRIIIRTDDDRLLYFDGYENVYADVYKTAKNKTVKNSIVEEIPDEYGGHTTNIKIIFSDKTEITLIDAYRPEDF